ncbi:glycine oxidase ThiO [Arenicella sp. 4NH20-0111]
MGCSKDMSQIVIVGSGVAGLCSAHYLLSAGYEVRVITASNGPDEGCCSWWAGGMLAPDCEQESAEPLIGVLGAESMAFWRRASKRQNVPFVENGSLVVAAPRDQSLLRLFARKTQGARKVMQHEVTLLEPDLAHFEHALMFDNEAHLEPRLSIRALWQECIALGANVEVNTRLSLGDLSRLKDQVRWLIDCRGTSANDVVSDLRGVKGEMLHLHCLDVSLRRPVRFLHPRHPIYLVPRSDNTFMLGATMLEVNSSKRASVRSVLELLSAAYVINPAFAEAEIIEIGVDARPAYDDNLPKIRRDKNVIFVNGLYRHGFLAAPAIARRVVDFIRDGRQCPDVFEDRPTEAA